MQSHPELRDCLVSCSHCGIRFLTHPRNARRRNLRCPFGCRQHDRRQRSRQRSTAYYQTAEGRQKKKRLNARRNRNLLSADDPQEDLDRQGPQVNESLADESPPAVELPREVVVLDESSLADSPMLPYVRMVIRLIDGVQLSCQEVVRLLRQALRQHSFGDPRRSGYLRCCWQQHPP